MTFVFHCLVALWCAMFALGIDIDSRLSSLDGDDADALVRIGCYTSHFGVIYI